MQSLSCEVVGKTSLKLTVIQTSKVSLKLYQLTPYYLILIVLHFQMDTITKSRNYLLQPFGEKQFSYIFISHQISDHKTTFSPNVDLHIHLYRILISCDSITHIFIPIWTWISMCTGVIKILIQFIVRLHLPHCLKVMVT